MKGLGLRARLAAIAAALAAVVLAVLGGPWSHSSFDPRWPLVVVAGLVLVASWLMNHTVGEASENTAEADRTAELARRELERHRKALDALAEGLRSAIFVCDERAGIQYANHNAQALFRFDNPIGRSILAVTISYELEQLVLNAVRSEDPVEAELAFSFPEERTAHVRAWREPNGDRVFVSLYDISELRRLERVRQDFVANVSHELRTPLAAIRSLAETLHDEPKSSLQKREDYLGRIMGEVDRLSMIVSDLLVLSTAELNPVRAQACDLSAILRSCVSLLQTKAEEKGLELTLDAPDSFAIQANATQMNQVFINLVDNAINYTVEGKVTIRLTPHSDQVTVEVSDTGIGIPSDQLSRIFERFYRVDKGRSRATGGTGLGLSIVKHIVEAHGGSVEVDSVFREGTTVRVKLPIGATDRGEPAPSEGL